MIFDILAFSCPLILCSFGALFSEYAGCLALFIEGLVSFSAFSFFTLTIWTHSPIVAFILTILTAVLIIFLFSLLIEKLKANRFIIGTGINLFLISLTSCFSWMIFNTRGVLTNSFFNFNSIYIKIITIIITILICTAAILFLIKTQFGLYIRITGSDKDVLIAKGVNPIYTRIASWCITALFSALAGIFLCLRISSFVPNISSGRGWMALAAVFLGNKKPWKIIIAVIIFCAADYFGFHIQNIFPNLPNSILLSLPYIAALVLTAFNEQK